jgi:hypothetical protein
MRRLLKIVPRKIFDRTALDGPERHDSVGLRYISQPSRTKKAQCGTIL